MKTADLEGPLLDYWVAKAQGLKLVKCENGYWLVYAPEPMILGIDRSAALNPAVRYSPSTSWAQAGPIIEAEKIDLIHYGEDGYKGGLWEAVRRIHTHYIDQRPGDATGGPTPLIAAMRAFVAAKFGDEIAETPP